MEKQYTEITRFTNNSVTSVAVAIEEQMLPRIAPQARNMLKHHTIPAGLSGLEKYYHIIPYVIYLPPNPRKIRQKVFTEREEMPLEGDQSDDLIGTQKDVSNERVAPGVPDSDEIPRLQIIHLARKKSGNGGYPGEFLGPLDAPELVATLVGDPRGLGTEIIIKDTQGRQYPIVATRYPVRDKEKGFREVVASPFEPGTESSENLMYGKLYYSFLMSHVEQLLRNNPPPWLEQSQIGLFSKVIQGLSLIENMDPSNYPKLSDGERATLMDDQVTRVFAVLGLNGPESFRRDSSAGAKGFFQIIGPTWNQLRRDYPHPLTNKEFQDGAIDHVSSAIMAYAHLSQEYREYLRYPRIADFFTNGGEKYIPYFLAAGYNSNVTGRAAELDRILGMRGVGKIFPKSAQEVFQIFFQNMRHANPKETEWYMKKLEFVSGAHLGIDLPPTPTR